MTRERTVARPRLARVFLAGLFLLVPAGAALAQSTRSLVNRGNDMYREEKFSDAEVNYRKALEKEKELVQGHFNLGDALTKQGKFDEAVKEYESAMARAEGKDAKAYAHYNIGNSMMKQQRYKDAVQSYIDALKLEPKDEDAKYNLSYALEKLKVPPPKQQNKDQDKKDQNKKDQDKKDQQKQDKQQQKKDQQDKQKQQQSPQGQQKQMSRADAQRILDVLKNSEKDVQKKLHTRQAVKPKVDKDW